MDRWLMLMIALWPAAAAVLGAAFGGEGERREARPRAREIGLSIGFLPSGPLGAITDVPGVTVGQVTIRRGDSIRTGVTAILPHARNLFREKVPGSVVVLNGFGKIVGTTQVAELGSIETPIVLTNTLAVPEAMAAVRDHVLAQGGNEDVLSVNPLVAEVNDGYLSDIRSLPVTREHVLEAIRSARGGPVETGAAGAGTGTRCLGFKGGIGSASRVAAGATVGVLALTNFGGTLSIPGKGSLPESGADPDRDGSCVFVVATDAALDSRQLRRLATRALGALAALGSSLSHGSGDYGIAFAVPPAGAPARIDADLDPLFRGALEAAEEAILDSMLRAETTTGRLGRTVEAIPIERVKALIGEKK